MRLALPLVALCSLIPISAFAQEYRVRPPGACPNQGDGQSWSCAAGDGQPGALVGPVTVWDRGVAGSVYYLAGGTWTLAEVWQLDAPADAEAVIRLVHANEQANGGDVGWSPDFAEPIAMRPAPSQNETAINISTPYWVLDGVHRAGWDAGYGWQISYRGGDGQSNETFVIVGDAASEVTIRNIHFLHTHRLTAPDRPRKSIWMSGAMNTVEYCFTENSTKFMEINAAIDTGRDPHHILIQHNYFYDCNSVSGGTHPDTIDLYDGPDYVTVRYNWFNNTWSGPVDHSITGQCTCTGLEVYGNVFQDLNEAVVGTMSSAHPCLAEDWKIYNNTIIYRHGNLNSGGAYGGIGRGFSGTGNCVDWSVENNLFYGVSGGDAHQGCGTWQHNYYNSTVDGIEDTGTGSIVDDQETTAQIFEGYDEQDYRLRASAVARNAGADLGAPYDRDLDGHPRGWDGDWDMGAHEYCDESCPGSGGAGGGGASGGAGGSGTGAQAGSAGSGNAPTGGAQSGPADESGCGCRTVATRTGGPSSGFGLVGGSALLLLARRPRRRARR